MINQDRPYRGRFAPSPTGELHFGSLIAAVASYLEAVHHNGKWLIRVEDIDPPREVAGSAQSIIRKLERLGILPAEEVLYQSTRTEAYDAAIDHLIKQDHAYWCGCSRSDLPASGIYPGTCRQGLPTGRKPRSVRLRTDRATVTIEDHLQGKITTQLEQDSGDFVIRRADGLPAYQLAVVVDDAHQSISHVVRGSDLLDSTPRQVLLQQKLNLHTPEYAHIPMVVDAAGDKLSKRLKSDPTSDKPPVNALQAALQFLGQHPPSAASLEELWEWALTQWDLNKVPRQREMPLSRLGR